MRRDTTFVLPAAVFPHRPARAGTGAAGCRAGCAAEIWDPRVSLSVFKARERDSAMPVYLIDCPELYERAAIYGSAPDEHVRFLLLTRATIETCQRMAFAPDIFHCHDWHTAMAPMYLRSTYTWDRLFAGTKTVLTIHNVGYQGVYAAKIAGEMQLDERLLEQDDIAADSINFLKHGILYADSVTTVSPTYAREIRTPEYGMGLQTVLEHRPGR